MHPLALNYFSGEEEEEQEEEEEEEKERTQRRGIGWQAGKVNIWEKQSPLLFGSEDRQQLIVLAVESSWIGVYSEQLLPAALEAAGQLTAVIPLLRNTQCRLYSQQGLSPFTSALSQDNTQHLKSHIKWE